VDAEFEVMLDAAGSNSSEVRADEERSQFRRKN
jgi:hypothetical protein